MEEALAGRRLEEMWREGDENRGKASKGNERAKGWMRDQIHQKVAMEQKFGDNRNRRSVQATGSRLVWSSDFVVCGVWCVGWTFLGRERREREGEREGKRERMRVL